jgi:HK97 family phage major capsid protein
MLRDNGADATTKDAANAIKRLDLDPQAKRGGMLTSHRQGTAYNKAAPGASSTSTSTTPSTTCRTSGTRTRRPTPSKLDALRNAAGSVSPADGGFLVPETLRSQLLQLALEQAVVRPLATVVPMDSARVPFPMIDSTTNQGSVYGGMIAFWGEEGAALQDSNPKFGRVVLDAKKLTGLSAVPNELLQDSIVSFSALIERLWPSALAFSEDNAFQSGTGTGEPLGFRGAGNAAAVTVTRSGGAGKITYPDVVAMYARMLPSSLSNAVWMCSPDACRSSCRCP